MFQIKATCFNINYGLNLTHTHTCARARAHPFEISKLLSLSSPNGRQIKIDLNIDFWKNS